MRIERPVVLGASGFLGSTLCQALAAEGTPARAFDRTRPADGDTLNVDDWVTGDFHDRDDLAAALDGRDGIYHLISTTIPATSNGDPAGDCRANVLGTLALLEQARQAGIRKVVFVSSGGTVYGVPEQVPIPECAPTEPICAYGISKLAIEKYLHLYHVLHGLEYCVLRVSNPFGERQPTDGAQGAVGVFLGKALRGEPIEIWGDGGVVRDYVYADDVTDALLRAMVTEGTHRVFNIGGGQGRSLREVLTTLEEALDRRLDVRFGERRPTDVPTNVLDIRRAESELGWVPGTAFDDGVRRLVRHHLGQVFD